MAAKVLIVLGLVMSSCYCSDQARQAKGSAPGPRVIIYNSRDRFPIAPAGITIEGESQFLEARPTFINLQPGNKDRARPISTGKSRLRSFIFDPNPAKAIKLDGFQGAGFPQVPQPQPRRVPQQQQQQQQQRQPTFQQFPRQVLRPQVQYAPQPNFRPNQRPIPRRPQSDRLPFNLLSFGPDPATQQAQRPVAPRPRPIQQRPVAPRPRPIQQRPVAPRPRPIQQRPPRVQENEQQVHEFYDHTTFGVDYDLFAKHLRPNRDGIPLNTASTTRQTYQRRPVYYDPYANGIAPARSSPRAAVARQALDQRRRPYVPPGTGSVQYAPSGQQRPQPAVVPQQVPSGQQRGIPRRRPQISQGRRPQPAVIPQQVPSGQQRGIPRRRPQISQGRRPQQYAAPPPRQAQQYAAPPPRYSQQYAAPAQRQRPVQEPDSRPIEDVPLGDHPISSVTHSSQKGVLDLLNLYYDLDPSTGVLGNAGKDFPTLHKDSLSQTKFSCSGKAQGYYADVTQGCQAYHHCSERGDLKSFLCPNGTIYNQRNFVCEWWYNVDCKSAPSYYNRNTQLFEPPKPATRKQTADAPADEQAYEQPPPRSVQQQARRQSSGRRRVAPQEYRSG